MCNTLVEQGPKVSGVTSTGTAPAAVGGTIVAGTYVMTALTYYTSSLPNGTVFAPASATIDLTPTSIALVGTDSDGNVARSTVTIATNGPDLSYVATCAFAASDAGAAPDAKVQFTATPTTFSMYQEYAGGDVQEIVYSGK